MKDRHGFNELIHAADCMRLSIAEWVVKQPESDKRDDDINKLGEAMQRLTQDLEELVSGNYDPAELLALFRENSP